MRFFVYLQYLYLKPTTMIKRKDGFNGERAIILPSSILSEAEKDPLLRMLHITDLGYYPKANHHFRERKEPIAQYVFIYCTEGAGWYRIQEKDYTLRANQFTILPAGKPHAYGADEKEPWTIYWIHFKGEIAQHLTTRNDLRPIEIKPSTNSRISNRIELFEEIFRTLELGYSQENLRYACSAFYHYLGTLRYLQTYRNASQQADANSDIVNAAIHFMKENIEKKLTLQDITAHIGYSVSHFSSLFNQRTGYAPMAYFNQLKIQQACRLLDFTNMKINQICYKIGIEDTYYFSRLFTKTMGMSPSRYRKTQKG